MKKNIQLLTLFLSLSLITPSNAANLESVKEKFNAIFDTNGKKATFFSSIILMLIGAGFFYKKSQKKSDKNNRITNENDNKNDNDKLSNSVESTDPNNKLENDSLETTKTTKHVKDYLKNKTGWKKSDSTVSKKFYYKKITLENEDSFSYYLDFYFSCKNTNLMISRHIEDLGTNIISASINLETKKLQITKISCYLNQKIIDSCIQFIQQEIEHEMIENKTEIAFNIEELNITSIENEALDNGYSQDLHSKPWSQMAKKYPEITCNFNPC